MLYKTTIDHNEIKTWIKDRGGEPVIVKATAIRNSPGIYDILFGPKDENFFPVSWDEFFNWFENMKLAFYYNPHIPRGNEKNGYDFINRYSIFSHGTQKFYL
jgi:hypothetical protein